MDAMKLTIGDSTAWMSSIRSSGTENGTSILNVIHCYEYDDRAMNLSTANGRR
jgi:hypothetical protein